MTKTKAKVVKMIERLTATTRHPGNDLVARPQSSKILAEFKSLPKRLTFHKECKPFRERNAVRAFRSVRTHPLRKPRARARMEVAGLPLLVNALRVPGVVQVLRLVMRSTVRLGSWSDLVPLLPLGPADLVLSVASPSGSLQLCLPLHHVPSVVPRRRSHPFLSDLLPYRLRFVHLILLLSRLAQLVLKSQYLQK